MIQQTFDTQLEAVEYLNSQGYKIGKSKLNADFKKGLIPVSPDGLFSADVLLGYAKAHCKTRARAEDQAAANANTQRTLADAENKRIMAERAKLKLAPEQGRLMFKDDHERDLALRAQFFKREIETFGSRLGSEIITLVDGDTARLPEFLEFWAEQTAEWMDAWAVERNFTASDEVSAESPLDIDLADDDLGLPMPEEPSEDL